MKKVEEFVDVDLEIRLEQKQRCHRTEATIKTRTVRVLTLC